MSRFRGTLGAFLLPLLLPACSSIQANRQVVFYSLPAGAEVRIDGESTGMYTPCIIDLGLFPLGREVTFRKPGYEPERRDLHRLFSLGLSRPSEASGEIESAVLLPLYWTAEDVLLPIKFETGLYPRNLFVRLVKEGG